MLHLRAVYPPMPADLPFTPGIGRSVDLARIDRAGAALNLNKEESQ
jgi:hypothetical protein